MMPGNLVLPDGRRGQGLAIALTVIAAAMLWAAAVSPLIGWYEARGAELAQQRALAAHMAALGRQIPALRAAVNAPGPQSANAAELQSANAAGPKSAADQVLLGGGSDTIAGANLQSELQDLATQGGTSLDSAELLPVQQVGEQAGALRRVSMQVSVTATWPVLIALLQAIGTARPRMITGTISLINSSQPAVGQQQPLQANFTVTAFRAGAP